MASVMVISERFSIAVDELGLNLAASRVPSYFQKWQVCITSYSTGLSSSEQTRVCEWDLQEGAPPSSDIMNYVCIIFSCTLHFPPMMCWWVLMGHYWSLNRKIK